MWRRLLFENLDLKIFSLVLTLVLIYVQVQRQIDVELKRYIPINFDRVPPYMSSHADQPAVSGSFRLRGPRHILRYANEKDFAFKIDVTDLELGLNEFTRTVPLTEQMLVTVLRPELRDQLEMVERSQVPLQVDLKVLPAMVNKPIPPLPTPEEGVTSYTLLQWRKEVNVFVPTIGEPAQGHTATVSPKPDKVLLGGPKEALEKIDLVSTVPQINIDGIDSSLWMQAKVEPFDPQSGLFLINSATGGQIEVEVKVERAH